MEPLQPGETWHALPSPDPGVRVLGEQPAEEAPRRVPTLLHFFLFLLLTVVGLVLGEALALLGSSGSLPARMGNPRLQFGAQLMAYALALGSAWLLFGALWRRPFPVGLHWNAGALRGRFIGIGLAVGFISQAVEVMLPAPKHAPIEDLFRSPGMIWILAGFGTLAAPLFEEIFFRGFLLPGLAHAIDWMRVPRDLGAMQAWRGSRGFSAGALAGASVGTSVLFALIHAPQIGYTWPAVGLLAAVSMVLCWVRVRWDSVAASAVVHACYNLSVFVTIFAGTGGFRHMERAT